MLSNTGSPSSVDDSDVDQRVTKRMKSAKIAVDNGVTTTIPVSGVNQCVEDTLCAHDLSNEMAEADSRNEAPARDDNCTQATADDSQCAVENEIELSASTSPRKRSTINPSVSLKKRV